MPRDTSSDKAVKSISGGCGPADRSLAPAPGKLHMVVPVCNPGTRKLVVGRTEDQGPPWLCSEFELAWASKASELDEHLSQTQPTKQSREQPHTIGLTYSQPACSPECSCVSSPPLLIRNGEPKQPALDCRNERKSFT